MYNIALILLDNNSKKDKKIETLKCMCAVNVN